MARNFIGIDGSSKTDFYLGNTKKWLISGGSPSSLKTLTLGTARSIDFSGEATGRVLKVLSSSAIGWDVITTITNVTWTGTDVDFVVHCRCAR